MVYCIYKIFSLNEKVYIFRKGSDAGDHPPITPMKAATENDLGHDAFRLYDYITRHFIATVNMIFQIF